MNVKTRKLDDIEWKSYDSERLLKIPRSYMQATRNIMQCERSLGLDLEAAERADGYKESAVRSFEFAKDLGLEEEKEAE